MSNLQVELVRKAMKVRIAEKLEAILTSVPGIMTYEFDRVRLLSSDFTDLAIPAVQLIDLAESITHEQARAKKTWSIRLELVLKEDENRVVSQKDLWNFGYKIERAIWKNPNFGIPGVLQAIYINNTTDLHSVMPYYLLKMDFDVLYYEDLVREC